MMYKCISLHQPFASLCVLRSLANPDEAVKPYETRHWPTNYRGTLLIHAAKKWDRDTAELCRHDPFAQALAPLHVMFLKKERAIAGLPFGCIVGVVELVECYAIVEFTFHGKPIMRPASGGDYIPLPTGDALAFGDFSVDRFAWKLAKPWMFKAPIPYVGRQGFFNVPAAAVAEQMKGAV